MTEKRIVCITDVCSSIFAGGDAPKKHFSFEQTEECCYPVFSNGENNNGLYGYTNTARVTEPSITVSARGTIGFTAIRLTPFTPIVRLISITPIQDIIDIDYLYYALSNYTPENTGTSIPQLTVPMIKKYTFRLPEKDEQKRAVKVLKQLDDIYEKEKKQIQKLDELIKSRFIEMFGRIKTNDKGWNITTVKKIADVRGRVGWKGYKKDDLRESGPLVLGATHLTDNGDLDLSAPVHLSREKYEESPEIVLQKNDLIFTQRGNTIGKVGLVTEDIGEATINPCVLIIRPINVNPLYLKTYFIMDDTKDDMWMLNSGSAQPMITQKGIGEYHLILPPITLQNQFADFVTQVEKQKATVQQSIDKLETLKKSLMQKYFG